MSEPQRERDADADEHEPLAASAVPGAEAKTSDRGEQAAGSAAGAHQRATPRRRSAPIVAAARALGDADDVGAGERVAGHGLDQRAGDAEGGADQQRRAPGGAAAGRRTTRSYGVPGRSRRAPRPPGATDVLADAQR